MLKNRTLVAALIVLLVPALASAGNSVFLQGDFGQVAFFKAAADYDLAINRVMGEQLTAAGGDYVSYRVVSDHRGNHVRFHQTLNGLRVHGASGVMHIDLNGKITGINGEFADTSDAALAPEIGAGDAMALALGKAGIPNKAFAPAAELAYVLNAKGVAVLSWLSTVEYRDARGPQRDMVFADARTGELVARHPQHHYARLLETRDCNNATNQCTANIVSNSPNPINTGDQAIDDAHNFAIATYDYYNSNHGRDGINDAGMEMISRVHFDTNYNNAFWDGSKMTYGDGDGTTFIPLSQDADVVSHELTHGVTQFESNLIYSNESGALNESLSDVFGAEVDRQEGATGADIWLIGEDIYTPGTPGDALRDMADPASQGDYDYYPTRYTGSADNGGVHWNSGISNLAFQLLSDGGSHPRGTTSVNVPAIGHSTAADIFYCANTTCLTASSNFQAMRNCTAGCTSGATADAVHDAWDAVGVPGGGGGPPPGGTCTDNNIWTGTISSGALVTPNCSASGTFNGVLQCPSGSGSTDLDLYLQKQSCGWGCSWSNVASSTSAACEEQINGYSGSSGTYRWNIDHYSGGTATIRLCTNKC